MTNTAALEAALDPFMNNLFDMLSTVINNCAEQGMTDEQIRAAITAHLAERAGR